MVPSAQAISPPASAVNIWPESLNGMCCMAMPVPSSSCSPPRCAGLPMPHEPYVTLSGCALAAATRSPTFFHGEFTGTVMRKGVL